MLQDPPNEINSSLIDIRWKRQEFDIDTVTEFIGKNGKIIAYVLTEQYGNVYVMQFSEPIIIAKTIHDNHRILFDSFTGYLDTCSQPIYFYIRLISTNTMMFEIYSKCYYDDDDFINLSENDYKNHVITMGHQIFNDISTKGIYYTAYEIAFIYRNRTSADFINEKLKKLVCIRGGKEFKYI